MSRRRRTATAAAAIVTLLALTVSCADDEPEGKDPDPTPSPTAPSPTETLSPEDQAVEDAEAALDRYFKVTNQVAQNPRHPLSKLRTVATSTGLLYTENIYKLNRDQGIRQIGEATYELDKVLDITLDNSNPEKGRVPTVQLQVCWDLSNVDGVDENGNSTVNPDRMDRSIATYWLSNYEWDDDPNGGWKVSSLQTKMEKPC